MKTWVKLVRICLICFFLYTLYLKWSAFDVFVGNLYKSTLIDGVWLEVVKYSVPTLEVLTVIMLLIINKNYGFYFSFFLMVLFTMYLIVLNNFSFYQGCSCGGIFYTLSYKSHLWVNFIFTLLSLFGILFFKEDKKGASNKDKFIGN